MTIFTVIFLYWIFLMPLCCITLSWLEFADALISPSMFESDWIIGIHVDLLSFRKIVNRVKRRQVIEMFSNMVPRSSIWRGTGRQTTARPWLLINSVLQDDMYYLISQISNFGSFRPKSSSKPSLISRTFPNRTCIWSNKSRYYRESRMLFTLSYER